MINLKMMMWKAETRKEIRELTLTTRKLFLISEKHNLTPTTKGMAQLESFPDQMIGSLSLPKSGSNSCKLSPTGVPTSRIK